MRRRSELMKTSDPLAFANYTFRIARGQHEEDGVTVTCNETGVSAWGPDERSAIEAEREAMARYLGVG